ncbi:MAG: prolyl oligopeptidase family serine peptidase [Planctomycetes bacterium]|nr:prolyl oligopeptidase family serine peptidase [Planctomycetota bacterium]
MRHEVTVRYLGGAVEDNRELAVLLSPLTHISRECPPMLIIHGEADDIVPVEESRLLHKALQKAGADSRLITVPGRGHGDVVSEDISAEIRKFFLLHLRGASA